jgi:hypothetical protein
VSILLLLRGEIQSPILDDPAQLLRELDNAALGFQEEQGFGVGDGNGSVRFLAT